MNDDLVSRDGRVFLQRIDREIAHIDSGREETRALLRDLRLRLCHLEGDLWAADASGGMDACIIGALRESAVRVLGGNCAFADGDLALLTELARRAVTAGLTDGLHKSVLANIEKAAASKAGGLNEVEEQGFSRLREKTQSPKVRTP